MGSDPDWGAGLCPAGRSDPCAPPRSLVSLPSLCVRVHLPSGNLHVWRGFMIAGSCSEVKPGCSCSCCRWFTMHLVVECLRVVLPVARLNRSRWRGGQRFTAGRLPLLETGYVSMSHFGASPTLFTRRFFFYVCVRVWQRLCRAEG